MKIYVVKSSRGEWEDYLVWNEKAFYKKEDAEKYAKELDAKHRAKPSFITDSFENDMMEGDELTPDWPPYDGPTSPVDMEHYSQWVKEQQQKEMDFLVNFMNEKGHNVTVENLTDYYEWESNSYHDWHDCRVEELEIV